MRYFSRISIEAGGGGSSESPPVLAKHICPYDQPMELLSKRLINESEGGKGGGYQPCNLTPHKSRK